MAQSRHHLKNAYYDIFTISNYFFENNNGQLIVPNKYKSVRNYCHYGNTSGKCHGYFELASSGVIHLLKTLRDKHHLEYDKLAEYAILWLNYKLNKKKNNKLTNLNHFYTNYIEKNEYYNKKINGNDGPTYKDIINKKKDLMDIKELSEFSYPFSILFYLNYVFHDESLLCTYYSGLAKDFVDQFKEFNNDSKNIEGSPYNKLLSTLSNDYKNLKNIYSKKSCNLASLPELTPQKCPVDNSVKGSGQNSLESSLEKSVNGSTQISVEKPVDNSVEISGKDSEQIIGQTLEVTSSSSSISTTLIPALSIFSIIPVFLGISYKVNNKELKT
ncbi:PIR protein CIR protein [Plasmodium vinckei petteri]|uniref:PIR protein CIR protein n=1 Tax=Plasmodium vinckei petteri TaxID=138298 RepID=A0A6V7T6R9_PLAVN|nr:PIR protein CIR protein [Plasmodium vinckei petteri]